MSCAASRLFEPKFPGRIYIFENSRELIIRDYEINAPIIEPPYNKMDITISCLFLKRSKKRLILFGTLHILPLQLKAKQIFHLGVVYSGIRTEILRNKIKNIYGR